MATAAAATDGPIMKLQIVVDKKKKRVIFAEANKEFVDFIFHILSLPVGAVQRILGNTSSSFGSIGTLYDGFNNLGDEYTEDPAKDYILNHLKAPYWGKNTTLLLPEASVNMQSSPQINLEGNEKGYVKASVTYMVMDNLVVRPAEPSSIISLINKHSIKNVGHIEIREVTFGTAEALKLLKASVSSKTVLTDVFLRGCGRVSMTSRIFKYLVRFFFFWVLVAVLASVFGSNPK